MINFLGTLIFPIGSTSTHALLYELLLFFNAILFFVLHWADHSNKIALKIRDHEIALHSTPV
jgi:hypothetical protein